MGTQLPLPQRGTAPQFSAHICCGQMAGWIKVPLGRELGLGPSDIVLPKGGRPPIFSPCLFWPNGWMDQDGTWHRWMATWYRGRPRPRPHCARWRPSSAPHKRGHSTQFLAHVYCVQKYVSGHIYRQTNIRHTATVTAILCTHTRGELTINIFTVLYALNVRNM